MLCTFEKSPLQEHAGKRVVVTRVQRILSPMRLVFDSRIRTSRAPELVPKEGELIHRLTRRKMEPWAVDVDRGGRFGQGLELLFDNELAFQSR